MTTAQDHQVQCVLVYSAPRHVLPESLLSTAKCKEHLNPGELRGSRKTCESLGNSKLYGGHNCALTMKASKS